MKFLKKLYSIADIIFFILFVAYFVYKLITSSNDRFVWVVIYAPVIFTLARNILKDHYYPK